METNTLDKKIKKSKKGLILKICIISVVVILIVSLGLTMIFKNKNSKHLSKVKQEFFNEAVMLFDEAKSSEYTLVDTTDSYEAIVDQTSEHILMLENRINSTTFVYKDMEATNNYRYGISLTYTGLNSIKSNYEISYDIWPDKYKGIIKEASSEDIATVIFSETTDGYKANLTSDTYNFDLDMEYDGDSYLITKTNKKTNVKTAFSFDLNNKTLTMSEEDTYEIALKGSSLQLTKTIEDTIYVANVVVTSKQNEETKILEYYYEYSFIKGTDKKYLIKR